MTDQGFDRRSFIKACAGVGAAGAAGAAGFGMLRPIADVEVEIVPISYPGVKVMRGSPAPYGLPLIPLEITSSGELKGRPDAAPDQLKWYKYCSHERAPGTSQDFETDNLARYFVTEEKLAKGLDAWYEDLIGDVVTVDDFPDEDPNPTFSKYDGVGAPFEWRSEGIEPALKITGIVVRMPKTDENGDPRISFDGATTPPPAEVQEWFPEDPNDPDYMYMACCSFCTHFCCVPGFHESQLAESSGYGQTIFCSCHLSRYDPFTIEGYNRTIFEYPGAAGEAGGEGGGGGH
jgi:Rieske Fe-S protein